MFGTGKKLDQLQQTVQGLINREEQKDKERKEQENVVLQRISGQMENLAEAAGKQETAIEDMLDTWEEWQEKLDAQAGNLQSKLLEKAEKELADKMRQEHILLEMTVSAWDQLFNLKLAARNAGDETWLRQLGLAENGLKEKAMHAGLQQTGRAGERFSYEIHEALERIDTDQPDLDMTVAEVYRPGYWYLGRAVRKAQVAVYRTKTEEEA